MYSKCVCGVVIAAAGSAALGQLSVYTDQAAWEAAVSGAGYVGLEESFDGLTILNMQPSGGAYAINSDFSITVEGAMGSSDDAFISGGSFHGEIFPATEHTGYRHDFVNNIVGFGQFYDGAASGLGIRISTSLGDIDIFDDGGYSGFQDGFLGFLITNGSSLSSVTIIGSDSDGGTAVGEIYDANNVVYAFVPTPGGVAILGIGGLLATRRRR